MSAHETNSLEDDLAGNTYLGEALLGLKTQLAEGQLRIFAGVHGGATYQNQQITKAGEKENHSATSPTASLSISLFYQRVGLAIEPSMAVVSTVNGESAAEFATKVSLVMAL